MINKGLKDCLLERANKGGLAFYELITHLENSPFEFVSNELRGPFGLATEGRAYFDLEMLNKCDDQYLFFTVLHEYCHLLRINKVGKATIVSNFSNIDFDVFIGHLIKEEIIADRFASLVYRKFNNETYPKYRTQQLEVEEIRNIYRKNMKGLHGRITDEVSYDKVLNSFIV